MSSSTSLPGARLGQYRLIRHIATGGMGAVYQAYDEVEDRVVALKVLSPELADNVVLLQRFEREARHAARMDHKNIVKLFDAATVDGTHFLVMEYIEGVDLAEYIKRKVQVDPEEARRIIIQACKAIEHAASLGVTHRDIKPSNFLLANDGGRTRVKLTDLGLARMTSEDEYRITRDGTTVGTVDYMSPEQARDAALADVRSDIYSLGCTLYHMLAGQPPFAEGGIGERIYKHLAADPPDVRTFNPKVSAALWTVLRRMLAKHMDDRFQTPADLIEALRSIAQAQPQPRRTESPSDSEALLDDVPEPVPGRPAHRPPSSSPEAKARPARPGRRDSTVPDLGQTVADARDAFEVSPEQRNAAAGQFLHATEVIRQGGDPAYPTQLLLSCIKLDPANTIYRKGLRDLARSLGAKKGSWLGSLSGLPARGRLRAALKAGEYRKVLIDGEELLTRQTGDVQVQLDMAEAAGQLGSLSLATWLLEEARAGAPKNAKVLRALALAFEAQNRYKQAISQWERLRELDPSDPEPADKIREISVNETLSRTRTRDRER